MQPDRATSFKELSCGKRLFACQQKKSWITIEVTKCKDENGKHVWVKRIGKDTSPQGGSAAEEEGVECVWPLFKTAAGSSCGEDGATRVLFKHIGKLPECSPVTVAGSLATCCAAAGGWTLVQPTAAATLSLLASFCLCFKYWQDTILSYAGQ